MMTLIVVCGTRCKALCRCFSIIIVCCLMHCIWCIGHRHYPEGRQFGAATFGHGWQELAVESNNHLSDLRRTSSLDVIVAVKHTGKSDVEEELLKVSDPRNQKYGTYRRLNSQFLQVLGTQKHAEKVMTWLREEVNATNVDRTIAHDFVRASLTITAAEQAFAVSLQPYRHRTSGIVRFGAKANHQQYSVPEALSTSVDFVSGIFLPRLRVPRPSPHEYTRQHGMRLKENDGTPGLDIVLVEARDRAFQVHVSVALSARQRERFLSGSFNKCLHDFIICGFEAVATPVRMNGHDEYLTPVSLLSVVKNGSCTNNTLNESKTPQAVQITCVVVLGPSLSLLNFAGTRLEMRALFLDDSKSSWARYKMLAYPAQSITVSDVRKLYNVPDGFRNRASQNSQSVANFLNNSASASDTVLFHKAMGMRPQPQISLIGGECPPSVEGNIDVQWIQAMGDNVRTTSWTQDGGYAAHEPFMEWLVDLANTSEPPLVHSISYGENEEDYSLAYENRVNLEFAKLGLRGVTILFATGDTGIQGAAQDGGTPPRCAPFAAVWPASSPYVTAVGGTMISNHISNVCNVDEVYSMGTESAMPFGCPETNIGEIVCSIERGAMITTGGGFSARFPRPAYQQSAVTDYLSQISSEVNTSLYNVRGRGYPDISAVGQNVPVFYDKKLVMVGGTSSSSPIVAGLLALLNGERITASLPPLGFINPLLYASYEISPQVVQDVRVGNNSGGNLLMAPNDRNCPDGFHALPGWDAATGLGSPNFQQMLQHMVFAPFRTSDVNRRQFTERNVFRSSAALTEDVSEIAFV
eukprot:TRINITY_DN30234_c0_g1_i1.p1 TRINITY_DN30234_c0_g1~~TRINITY_DN30234_c0_g1_i1.p1  ORF type:complete len:818 (+),score=39.04 TRINITY_DN30234_c0_g1_i1:31-2454(+)